MTIHQITIVFRGEELAYSEGESVEYAFEDAHEQATFPGQSDRSKDEWQVIHLYSGKRQCLAFWDAVQIFC